MLHGMFGLRQLPWHLILIVIQRPKRNPRGAFCGNSLIPRHIFPANVTVFPSSSYCDGQRMDLLSKSLTKTVTHRNKRVRSREPTEDRQRSRVVPRDRQRQKYTAFPGPWLRPLASHPAGYICHRVASSWTRLKAYSHRRSGPQCQHLQPYLPSSRPHLALFLLRLQCTQSRTTNSMKLYGHGTGLGYGRLPLPTGK